MSWTLRLTLLAVALTATRGACPNPHWHQNGTWCFWKSPYKCLGRSAIGACAKLLTGAEDVKITDAATNEFVAEVAEGLEAWTGLRIEEDDSTLTWKWADGTTPDYVNWDGGVPGRRSAPGCAVINDQNNNGLWTGESCTGYRFPFICQIADGATLGACQDY